MQYPVGALGVAWVHATCNTALSHTVPGAAAPFFYAAHSAAQKLVTAVLWPSRYLWFVGIVWCVWRCAWLGSQGVDVWRQTMPCIVECRSLVK